MSVLDGYLKFPGFDSDDGTVQVVTQERNNVEVLLKLNLKVQKAQMHIIDLC